MRVDACIYLEHKRHDARAPLPQVKHKYDQTVMTLFAEVFCWLPLAATLNGGVFITHGGLPAEDSCSLDDVAAVKRGREPPDSGIMSDLMWSDPQPFVGRSPSKRGVGMAFGPDVTRAFLEGNGLRLLVRSHEVKEVRAARGALRLGEGGGGAGRGVGFAGA